MKRLILFISFFCAGAVAFTQPGEIKKKALVLATYTYATNNRLDNLRPLAQYLQKETGIKIVTASYATVQQLIEAVLQGKVDLAMINTLGYISFQRNNSNIAVPLVSLDQGSAGLTNYGGCILAGKQSGISSIKDLKKDAAYSFALVNKASTSGNLVPRLVLNSNGISKAEEHFDVYYAGTHKQVVEDLLSGKAAIGGCGCSEYDKHAQTVDGFTDKVRKVASFNNIPLGPVMYRKTLPATVVQKLEKAFLQVHEKNPGVFRKFCAGWSEFLDARNFRRAGDADYDEFRALFGANESLWKLLDE